MKLVPRSAIALSTALAALALSGCATMPDVAPVRVTQLGPNVTLPLVIELQAGDRLPLAVSIEGDLVHTEATPQPPVLVVKRHFYLVLLKHGPPRISFDGKTLGGVMGSFQLGVGSEKEGTAKATLGLTVVERK